MPPRVKNLVEALPVRAGGAEERPESRLERRRAQPAGDEDREGVPRLGKPDRETAVAEHPREAGEAAADAACDRPRGAAGAWVLMTSSCHFAEETLDHPQVRRERSSWVLSRQIIVSWTASGSRLQIVNGKACESCRPVERFGDARHLAKVLLRIAAIMRAI